MCLFGTGGSSTPTEPRNDVTHEWTDAQGAPDKVKSGGKNQTRKDIQGREAGS